MVRDGNSNGIQTRHMSQGNAAPSEPRGLNGLGARLASLLSPGAVQVPGFVGQPEPKTIGSHARGRQLLAGNFQFAGHLVEAPDRLPWDIAAPDDAFAGALHGFAWLDDIAAVPKPAARECAQSWTYEWIRRYGGGRGPGWAPNLAGRRLLRWINHSAMLLQGRDPKERAAYFRSLATQTRFVARRWKRAQPGLPRIEALTGLICAGLALTGMSRLVAPARLALARECQARIDPGGGIATRNPEELLEVFTLLAWAAAALGEAGRSPDRAHLDAIVRIAPVLRALRHADGGLARFHGGGRGLEGRLDQALAAAGVRTPPPPGLSMGFARLSAGRTSVIVDAASPPKGAASANAHASTLAFELTSGRRPLIVNCGSGAVFGGEWHRAGRATPSHSTLCLAGLSSSRLGAEGLWGRRRRDQLADIPRVIRYQQAPTEDGTLFVAAHDGYAVTHGLTHVRQLDLGLDGRQITGEDTLGAMTAGDRRRLDGALRRAQGGGVRFDIRFHLHPDVDATLDLGGTAVSMALKSGEIWIFRHDGTAKLDLEPSVYLEKGRLKPQVSRQIVLSGTVADYAVQIGWTLAKAQDTPQAVRDVAREEIFED